ncbi:hypothetical protein ACFL0M_10665 [Thermodesulfobacteriota bacterium]
MVENLAALKTPEYWIRNIVHGHFPCQSTARAIKIVHAVHTHPPTKKKRNLQNHRHIVMTGCIFLK